MLLLLPQMSVITLFQIPQSSGPGSHSSYPYHHHIHQPAAVQEHVVAPSQPFASTSQVSLPSVQAHVATAGSASNNYDPYRHYRRQQAQTASQSQPSTNSTIAASQNVLFQSRGPSFASHGPDVYGNATTGSVTPQQQGESVILSHGYSRSNDSSVSAKTAFSCG